MQCQLVDLMSVAQLLKMCLSGPKDDKALITFIFNCLLTLSILLLLTCSRLASVSCSASLGCETTMKSLFGTFDFG